jgi:hypothetical protein
MLLRLSKLAAALGSQVSSLPGVSPDPQQGQEALAKEPVLHGLEGRLMKGLGVGNKLKTTQGPRAYGPRLAKQ